MNIASFIGDVAHLVAIFLILGWIWHKKSCEGISGKMHILYAIVFTTRYLDLTIFISYYLTFMKIFFIIISYVIIVLIYVMYKKTYEREYDLFWIETLLVLCLGLGLLETRDIFAPEEVLWAFSRYLEAVTVIPQLYFTYKKEVKSNIIWYYIMALILYRFFYIINWAIRYQYEYLFDPYVVYPGLVQFVLYFLYFILPNAKNSTTNGTILPTTMAESQTSPIDSETLKTSTTGTTQTATILPGTPPSISREESLLETPFLKRNAASYLSIYTIDTNSNRSSPTGSVSGFSMFNGKPEERY